MVEQKETFVFYINWINYIELLEPNEIKDLISIICDYVKNLKEPKKTNLSDRLLMTWMFIKNQLDKDKAKYDKRCETSKINGKKGGRPKTRNNLKKPKKPDNDNEYDNEYEHDNDITTTSSKSIASFVESNFGRTLSPIEYEQISLWENSELTRYAIKQAVLNGKYNIKYINSILNSYEKNNVQTVQQSQIKEEEFKQKKPQEMSFKEREYQRQQELLWGEEE